MSRVLATLALAGCFSKPAFDPQPRDASADAEDENDDGAVDVTANIAFLTSVPISVDELGSVAAADELCATRAATAGLPQNTYLAWLSTPSTSAAERLGTASGWVRTDGRPFASTVASLTSGEIYHPLRLDELGGDRANVNVATATTETGALDARDCSGFAGGTAEGVLVGAADATRKKWTDNLSAATCAAAIRFYCFGVDQQSTVTVVPAAGRVAFISTRNFLPSVDGLGGADAICNEEAANAGVPGQFGALLATTTVPAASRFLESGERWVRRDGVPLSGTSTDLLNGSLLTSLNVDSSGNYVSDAQVWTGVDAIGTLRMVGTNTCGDWTDSTSTAKGTIGTSVRSNALWYRSAALQSCDVSRRVYCLQR